ncbi:protein disulfide-isomerase precursor [Ascosphaera acerosa]|nr:protein disulfide-isomerase precursor [Ascosphaera acerosa]
MAAGIPLGYIFAETQEERDELAAMLRPVAKQFKGKINLATIDARDAGSFAYTLRLEQKFPAFSIQDTLSSKRYPFDQDKTITEQGISQFIAGVLDGTIQHHVRSQPVPETQDGPVTVVVAHSFDEIVMDDLKDVLVEYYAPWCMHCQALAPKYDELAALVKKAGLDSQVTIAKIDATENDVPVEIASYPTIMLYSAGLKHMPILFEEVREIETLAKFIRENGKHGADALAAAGSSEEQEEAVEIAHTVSATTAATTSDAATITDAATSTVQDSQQDPVITLFVKSAEPSRATEAPAHEEL